MDTNTESERFKAALDRLEQQQNRLEDFMQYMESKYQELDEYVVFTLKRLDDCEKEFKLRYEALGNRVESFMSNQEEHDKEIKREISFEFVQQRDLLEKILARDS